ncbi:conjugal transfer protein TraJ [Salmonella enterica subsp. enterica serovar Newport]|nr:conjugal transfer protein TraJ [Salmonella enterica subsp. enterica serovar Newport]
MCPMDRIQREHCRQTKFLNGLKNLVSHFPYPACIRNASCHFEFCNVFFNNKFLMGNTHAEQWFLQQSTDFLEVVSRTEMETFLYRDSHFVIEDAFIKDEFWNICFHLYSCYSEDYVVWSFVKSLKIRSVTTVEPYTSADMYNIMNELRDRSKPVKWNAFNLYAGGLSHSCISGMLNISPGSSKNYASQVCELFSKNDRDELILSLHQSGVFYKVYNNVFQLIKKYG